MVDSNDLLYMYFYSLIITDYICQLLANWEKKTGIYGDGWEKSVSRKEGGENEQFTNGKHVYKCKSLDDSSIYLQTFQHNSLMLIG